MTTTNPPLPDPPQLRRRYPAAPLVGVAAAVFNTTGAVLLVQRGRPPGAGQWGVPGGLLDVGEKLQDGACREVREECAIEVAIGGIAGVFEPITRDAAGAIEYHYVVIDFWASYVSGVLHAADDAAAAAWVDLYALDQYPMPAETRQVIQKAHAMWQAASRG